MDFSKAVQMLNYECFKFVFLTQSSREKKQMLLEYGAGKVVRDDKIRKLYDLFISGPLENENAKILFERFFFQNTFYNNASLRDDAKALISKFLDFNKIDHSEAMLDDKGVSKLKKLKVKHYKQFLKKGELSDRQELIFFIYSMYTAIEYGLKDIYKYITDAEEFKKFRK